MTVRHILIAGCAVLIAASPVQAQDAATTDAPSHAVGTDVTFSTDADNTDVLRIGGNFDWRYRDSEHYQGLRFERTWYDPAGGPDKTDERVYFRMADEAGAWKYALNVGTNGQTVLGSASIHNEAPFRQEYFIERDRVETSQGVSRPIYYTFGGAALDIPFSDRAQLTVLGGLQEFTGDNLRVHARANAIFVVKPEWGLSVQLRTRYFRNSEPDEYDYYSPRWYAEALPVLQLRRFSNGWRYLVAAGWGAQRDSRSDWRQSRYANLRVSSPSSRKGWSVNGDATYSNVPITDAPTYDYLRLSFGLTRAF